MLEQLREAEMQLRMTGRTQATKVVAEVLVRRMRADGFMAQVIGESNMSGAETTYLIQMPVEVSASSESKATPPSEVINGNVSATTEQPSFLTTASQARKVDRTVRLVTPLGSFNAAPSKLLVLITAVDALVKYKRPSIPQDLVDALQRALDGVDYQPGDL